MPYCVHVDLGGGSFAIARIAGKRPEPCRFCRKKPSERLCDWKVAGGKTCDAPMCAECAIHVGKDKDICPAHREAYERWAAQQPQMALALKQESA